MTGSSGPTRTRSDREDFGRCSPGVDLFAGDLTRAIIDRRIFWSRQSPLSEKSRRAIRWKYIAVAHFWTVALTAITLAGQGTGFLRAWVLPWWLAGMLQTGRTFTEHLGMESDDPLQGTRTVFGGGLVTRVCSYLNSDIFIHGPHRRTPRVTADELHSFAAKLKADSDGAGLPFYPSYAAAIRSMLPHLLKNPGVGKNAQKETPARHP